MLDLLEAVAGRVREGLPADAAMKDIYRNHREFGSRDRRLYSNLVFSFFRWKGWTDLAAGQPLALRAAAAFRLDFPESHPAVDLIAPLDPPAETPDSLPAKARQIARWLRLDAPPSPLLLIPPSIAPLLEAPAEGSGPEPLLPLLDSFQERPPTWIRIRTGHDDDVRAAAVELGIPLLPHPRLPLAWQAPDPARLADLLARCRGLVEIQDVASQAVGFLAGDEPGRTWWDVCAGSGGKSLHLADLARGRIRILATDVRAGILEEADRRVRQAGLSRAIRLKKMDAAVEPVPETQFDGVLVDAPCSGTGTWARNPDARWRLSPEQVQGFADTQSLLLSRVAGTVRPGGVLIYATCSLTRAENAGVLDRFLKSRPDFSPSPFLNVLTGEAAPGRCYFWPWQGPGSGLFAARLVRNPDAAPMGKASL